MTTHSQSTPARRIRKIFDDWRVLLTVVVAGLTARLWAASLGHNYDMDSWFAVADITGHGGNVYAETSRYNYGPVWFQIVHLLDVLAGHRQQVLRYFIAAFLSLVDVGIFLCLCQRAGRLAGVLFFLNPISILISGFHCQFDNLAILIGLWSVWLLGDDFEKPVDRRKISGLVVLGLSLATKHIFFVFPVWLAIKQKGFWQKIIILAVPAACFLLSFAPFWGHGREGIINNVFGYHSSQNGYAYKFFLPQCIQFCWDSGTVWYGMLILFAFVCRTRNAFESLLIYSGVLVTFAPGTANQYLAIPVALAAVFPSVPFVIYSAVGAFNIIADATNGPRLWPGVHGRYDDLAIYTLFIALAWLFWKPQFLRLIQWVRQEIEIQLGRTK